MKTLIDVLQSQTDSHNNLSYRDFIKTVLYDPQLGYYTKNKNRVGRSPKSDFYTAESLGPVFRDLVLASIHSILGAQTSLSDYTFIELGPEPQQQLLAEYSHPFKDTLSFRPSEEIQIPQNSIIFANEILDAQPFHRLIWKTNQWREIGVNITRDTLTETLLDQNSFDTSSLPPAPQEDYIIDYPRDAELLLTQIVEKTWSGLLLFFDYGHVNQVLLNDFPQGTARAYFQHTQQNNLLSNLGEQDITCHVWWDPLIQILKKHNFTHPSLFSQERFFMTQATNIIENIITRNPEKFDPKRQTLKELLHPGNMGMKFQVLWANRL